MEDEGYRKSCFTRIRACWIVGQWKAEGRRQKAEGRRISGAGQGPVASILDPMAPKTGSPLDFT